MINIVGNEIFFDREKVATLNDEKSSIAERFKFWLEEKDCEYFNYDEEDGD